MSDLSTNKKRIMAEECRCFGEFHVCLRCVALEALAYLEAEIEEWKGASGLVDVAGDPDGITPAKAQEYWRLIESRVIVAEAQVLGLAGKLGGEA